jgi:restriction endonuclease
MAEALLLASSFECDLLAVPQQCDRLTREGTTNECVSLKITDPSKKNALIESKETIFVAFLTTEISSSLESEVQDDALAIGDLLGRREEQQLTSSNTAPKIFQTQLLT